MKRYLAVAVASLGLNGCVMMSKHEFVKQQELWQSVGRLTGIVECQNYLVSSLNQRVIKAEEKPSFKVEEKKEEKKDEPVK